MINGISSNLQQLLIHFNRTTIFLFFRELFVLWTEFAVFPTRIDLYLNDWELSEVKSSLLVGTSSLLNYHQPPDASDVSE